MRLPRPAGTTRVAAVVTAGLVVQRLAVGARYLTNDDAAIALILDGSYWGTPSPHVVFVSPALSWPLSLLERLLPPVPWYLVALDAALVAAATAAVVVVRGRAPHGRPAPTDLLLWTAAALGGLHYLMTPSFTVAALLLSGTGLLLWAESTEGDRRRVLVGGVLVGVGGLLRSLALPGALIVVGPWIALRHRARPASLRILVPGVVVAALLVATGYGARSLTYRHRDDWNHFFAYNRARVQLLDTPRVHRLTDPAVLEATGWTVEDAVLLSRWYHPDPDIYGLEALGAAVDAVDATAPSTALVDRARRAVDDRVGLVVTWALVVGGALVAADRRDRLGLLAFVTWSITVLAALSTVRRVAGRVSIPLLAVTVVAALAAARRGSTGGGPVRLRSAVAVVALAVAVVPFAAWLRSPSRIREDHRTFAAIQADLVASTGPDTLVVDWAASVHPELSDPLGRGDQLPRDVLPTGWQSHSPPWYDLLRRRGITDVDRAIATDPEVVLVVDRTRLPDDKTFERRLAGHTGIRGRLRPRALLGPDGRIELADLVVDITLEPGGDRLVETTPPGGRTVRGVVDGHGAWALDERRWPIRVVGWVDTGDGVGAPLVHDGDDPGAALVAALPPRVRGPADTLVAVLYDGVLADLAVAVADPDSPGRWWFDARVRGGDPALWSVYLLDGDRALRVPPA